MKKIITLSFAFLLLTGQALASGFDFGGSTSSAGPSVISFFSSIYISAPTSMTTDMALYKEEIEQVSVDAYNFLAGEEMTLALEHQVHTIREKVPETQNMTDEQVATLMLEAIHN